MLVTILMGEDKQAVVAVDPKRVLAVVRNDDNGKVEILLECDQRLSLSGDFSVNEIVLRLNAGG